MSDFSRPRYFNPFEAATYGLIDQVGVGGRGGATIPGRGLVGLGWVGGLRARPFEAREWVTSPISRVQRGRTVIGLHTLVRSPPGSEHQRLQFNHSSHSKQQPPHHSAPLLTAP